MNEKLSEVLSLAEEKHGPSPKLTEQQWFCFRGCGWGMLEEIREMGLIIVGFPETLPGFSEIPQRYRTSFHNALWKACNGWGHTVYGFHGDPPTIKEIRELVRKRKLSPGGYGYGKGAHAAICKWLKLDAHIYQPQPWKFNPWTGEPFKPGDLASD